MDNKTLIKQIGAAMQKIREGVSDLAEINIALALENENAAAALVINATESVGTLSEGPPTPPTPPSHGGLPPLPGLPPIP